MKKIMKSVLIVFALAAFTACGNQNGNTGDQQGAGAEIDVHNDSVIETDTAITQDPDTSTYHDMTQ